jgi:chemotaxis protein MotB
MHHALTFAACSLLLSGCVSLDKYNALKLERDQFSERLTQAEAEARAERARAKVLKDQLDLLLANRGDEQGLVQTLTRQNAELQAKYEELNRKYLDALTNRMTLPEPVSNELEKLAAQYPDVMTFDASRGMIKFTSDVTFASGSAEVTARAKEVLARVAQILNTPSVARFELLVAGHTDNVVVRNPVTIRMGHKDNWYLSAHRAISVGEILRGAGTAQKRLGVVGYADQHPVAPNASEAGKAQNRRVEILVLPTTIDNAGAPAAKPAVAPSALPEASAAPAQ